MHCVLAHRTSKPPAPETIEAKIVASADNLAHFAEWETLTKNMSVEKALMKVRRDIHSDFMLPEAVARANELAKKYKIDL